MSDNLTNLTFALNKFIKGKLLKINKNIKKLVNYVKLNEIEFIVEYPSAICIDLN